MSGTKASQRIYRAKQEASECRLAVSGTIDRDDKCAACGRGLYFRVEPESVPVKVLTKFCGDMRCKESFKEIPE